VVSIREMEPAAVPQTPVKIQLPIPQPIIPLASQPVVKQLYVPPGRLSAYPPPFIPNMRYWDERIKPVIESREYDLTHKFPISRKCRDDNMIHFIGEIAYYPPYEMIKICTCAENEPCFCQYY
jgi:hypothetical protein